MRLAVLAAVDLVAVQVDVIREPHGLNSAHCAYVLGNRVEDLKLELNCVNRCSCGDGAVQRWSVRGDTVRVAAVREKEGSGEVFPAQAQKTLLADARVSEWVEMQVQLDFDQRCCALLCSVLFCPVPSFSCSRARSPDSEVGGCAEVDVGAAGWAGF